MVSDLQDFDGFYRRTYPAAYRTALGIVGSSSMAEDATQEAYLDAFRGRFSYRSTGSAEAWLQRIVVNRAIDQLRRHKRRNEVTFELADEPGESRDGELNPSDLLDAIAALSPRQRAAVVLRHFHGYPVSVVGEILGTSGGGASMLLQRAMEQLRAAVASASLAGGTTSSATKSASTRR